MKISRSMLLWGGIFLAIVMFLGSYSVKEGFFRVKANAGDTCSKNQVGRITSKLICVDSGDNKYVWKEKE